jgi:hypothetical protein
VTQLGLGQCVLELSNEWDSCGSVRYGTVGAMYGTVGSMYVTVRVMYGQLWQCVVQLWQFVVQYRYRYGAIGRA